MNKDPMGDRMKGYYENRNRHFLLRRMPVIIRVDGKTFNSYTAPLKNRFDDNLIKVMNLTAIKLCEEIQGAKCGYIQSDEISILLTDFDTLQTQAWFDNNQSKIESVSAAIASVEFTKNSWLIWSENAKYQQNPRPYYSLVYDDIKDAYFDSRAFNIPEADVCNYMYWRQRDCIRNSILSLGFSLYSAKELHGKNTSEIQEMCFQKGHNWNDLSTSKKRGRCVIKTTYEVGEGIRSKWIVDDEIPEFNQNRDYIEKYLVKDE